MRRSVSIPTAKIEHVGQAPSDAASRLLPDSFGAVPAAEKVYWKLLVPDGVRGGEQVHWELPRLQRAVRA